MLANFHYEASPVAVVLGAVAALGVVICWAPSWRPAMADSPAILLAPRPGEAPSNRPGGGVLIPV